MDIDEINEMFPDELLSDAEFEKALDALCANPDDDFKREITELMSEHQIITIEEAEQILGDTGDEPVKCSLSQQTRPTEPDNDTNVEETIQRLMQNDPGLVNVNLNNMKRIPVPKIKKIIEAMAQSEFIEQLSLANVGLYDNDVAPLIEILQANDSLRKLNLETNFLSGEFFAKLFHAVNKNQSVEEVKAVNQGMNFSTTAEKDIVKALKENHSLTKISMNIRLPELRNKIQQVTMRNQEIRRIMRKRAADEQRALEEEKKRLAEEEARRKAELEKAKQPMKVFPKELLHKKKPEEPKKGEVEKKSTISKIVSENNGPAAMAPMILGEPISDSDDKPKKRTMKDIAPKHDIEPVIKDFMSKPVLKKLPSLDRNPVVSQVKEPAKLEQKEWPPRPKHMTNEPEKPAPKKNPLLTKWEGTSNSSEEKTSKVDDLLTKEEPGKIESKFLKKEKEEEKPKEPVKPLRTRVRAEPPKGPLSASALSALGMELGLSTSQASEPTPKPAPKRFGDTLASQQKKLEEPPVIPPKKIEEPKTATPLVPTKAPLTNKLSTGSTSSTKSNGSARSHLMASPQPFSFTNKTPLTAKLSNTSTASTKSTASLAANVPQAAPKPLTTAPKTPLATKLSSNSTSSTTSALKPNLTTESESCAEKEEDKPKKKKKIIKKIVKRKKKVVPEEEKDGVKTENGINGVAEAKDAPGVSDAKQDKPQPKPEQNGKENGKGDAKKSEGESNGTESSEKKRLNFPDVAPKPGYTRDYLSTRSGLPARSRNPYTSTGLNRYNNRF